MVRGSDRVDTGKLAKAAGMKKPRIATPSELESILGAQPGGVCPIWCPSGIPKFIDSRVLDLETVLGSAGSELAGLMIQPSEILRVSKPKIVDIAD